MRIAHQTSAHLILEGRRQDGEEGQPGLWLLWLVACAFLTVGVTVFTLSDRRDPGLRYASAAIALAGIALLAFGVYRAARRERLELDLTRRTLRYSTRVRPGRWHHDFDATFDAIKGIRVQRKVETVQSDRARRSATYVIWYARLLVKPRKVIELARELDETAVRSLAEAVVRATGASLLDGETFGERAPHPREDPTT